MATYKVLQDIEAEDKLLGPLTFRQFIYAGIVATLGFVCFKIFFVNPLLIMPLLPPMALFGVLAAPFGHDQSSEVWLLAKIRFMLKPRIRIWDQTGLSELVTITAPIKLERHLTKNLDQIQVRSRLEALAQTIDTRGWAVKGVNVNLYSNPVYGAQAASSSSDRLVDPTVMSPMPVADVTITPVDDMLDIQNNPVAQQLDQLVKVYDQAHRQDIMQQMQAARTGETPPAADLPFGTPAPYVPPAQSYATFNPQTVQPNAPVAVPGPDPAQAAVPTLDDQLLTTQFARNNQLSQEAAYGRTKVIQPLPHETPSFTLPQPAPLANQPKPDILGLANNDDLSVATIARQANMRQQTPDGEVVVTLR